LSVGAKAPGFRGQITAIAIENSRAELQAEVAHIAASPIQRLDLELSFVPEDV
jgi:hypothetical protein